MLQKIEKELDKDTYHGYGIQNFPGNRSAFRDAGADIT